MVLPSKKVGSMREQSQRRVFRAFYPPNEILESNLHHCLPVNDLSEMMLFISNEASRLEAVD